MASLLNKFLYAYNFEAESLISAKLTAPYPLTMAVTSSLKNAMTPNASSCSFKDLMNKKLE